MLAGVSKYDGVSYASLIDRRNGFHYLLSTNTKSELDVELSSVQTELDPLGPSAIIRKGGTSVLLKTEPFSALNSSLGAPVTVPSPSILAPGAAPSAPSSASALSKLKLPPGAVLPLVFQEVDPKRMTLTDEQKGILNQLRQAFIDDVNGTTSASGNQNVSSSANSTTAASPGQQLKNWLSAQEKSDEQFRMLYGNQAFNAYTESSSYPTPP